MMGRGADGSFAGKTGGAHTNIGFDARSLLSSVSYQTDRQMGQPGRSRKGVDLFSQVLKALALRPAHGADDHVSASMSISAGSGTVNLPHSSENKRKTRLKRSDVLGNLHRDFESSWNRDPCVNQFWLHMDEYFRDLTSDDIQILLSKTKLSELSVWNDWDPLFLMSPAGPSLYKDNGLEEHTKVEAKEVEMQEPQPMPILAFEEDAKEDTVVKVHEQQPVQSVTGVKRKFFAASAVSKRRKLMVSASEVITTRISPPEHDDGELCHVCYGGDSNEQDQILFCDSCNVAVHQECYGIKAIPEGQWLCSWCSNWNFVQGERLPSQLPDCVLCPVKGGAVKLVAGNQDSDTNSGKTMFAHLFCCQWIPETFIRDVEVMEPIMNVEGVRDERWKLLCSVCKEKDGACIQCSHGMCATAFHPLCARQAKLRMEVSSKEGSKEIELRAFCSKHSVQAGKLPVNKLAETEADCGTLEVNALSHSTIEDCPTKAGGATEVTNIEDSLIKAQEGSGIARKIEYPRIGVVKEAFMMNNESIPALRKDGNCSEMETAPCSAPNLPNFKGVPITTKTSGKGPDARCLVRNTIEQTHATTADVAMRMGIPNNSLSSWLQGNDLCDEEVQKKIHAWISSDSCCHPSFQQLNLQEGRHALGVLEIVRNENHNAISQSNKKNKVLKTYHNKRQKNEQKVLSPEMLALSMVKDKRGLEKKHGERQGFSGVDAERETSQDVEIVHSNIGAESDVSFDEERRQRGLSGEASTSQDISCTPQTSVEQLCNLATVQKGRRKPICCAFEVPTQLEHIAEFKREGGIKQASSLPLQHASTHVFRNEMDLKQDSILDRGILAEGWKMANCRLDVQDSKVSPNENAMIAEGIPRPRNGSTHLNVHPFIVNRLQEIRRNTIEKGYEGEGDSSRRMTEGFSVSDDLLYSSSPCVEHQESLDIERDQSAGSKKVDVVLKPANASIDDSLEAQIRQLEHARRLGMLDMGLQDELEEEILALQERLIVFAEKNYYQSEHLILKVITKLSDELQSSQKRAKNLILVNQYLSELREAKKQGRKERRNKEAQAVLAAATAAAAASPRLGSFRRDGPGGPHIGEAQYSARGSPGEIGQTFGTTYSMPATSHLSGVDTLGSPALSKPLKVNIGVGRTSSSSRTSLREKASLARQVDRKELVPKSRGIETSPAETREELASCDICSSKDCSPLNKIVACQLCKVAVHQDCYGISTVPIGDWYCQPCSEILRQFQGLRIPEAADRGRPGHGVACALCSGQSGAFKRSVDSGWAHVFCAQWIPETTVEKDQTGMVEGLKLIPMERFLQQCSVCRRQQGACLRCSFGHCHGAFHPSCARESGLYMSVKCNPGGRIQYRAYCERHSPQQREKAEARRCGSSDELSALKQMRVELERVRIICERICRRERIKRDLLVCTRDMHVARISALPLSMMASNDLSATSNSLYTPITVFKRNSLATDDEKNGSMAVKPQRLESESYSWNSVAGEVNRYQDSPSGDSAYQTQLSCSEPSRSQIGSSVASIYGQERHNAVGDAVVKSADQRRPKKHRKQAETLHTEVVMTPTEASVQNQRLPKGYAYVPVVLLSKGKMNPSESAAPEL